MAKVELFDGVYFDYFGVDSNTFSPGDDFEKYLSDKKHSPIDWNENTKFLANFTDNIGGSNFDGTFDTIDHFAVYRRIGNDQTLYKVCETNDKFVEDFVVGNLCDCTYVIHPISKMQKTANNGVTKDVFTTQHPFESKPFSHDSGAVSIFGLIKDNNSDDVYTIDHDQLWTFRLNLVNEGTTLNINKSFTDTQNRFQRVSYNNKVYNTETVSGLLGRYDCFQNAYIDSYDLIKDWENFATSPTLKLLKDIRGRLFICDIDSSSIKYINANGSPVEVSFSVKEIESIENIEILGDSLSFNPVTALSLLDANGRSLMSTDEKTLVSRKDVNT